MASIDPFRVWTQAAVAYSATIKVPLSFPKIQFYISTANTLSYTCTSSEIMLMIVFLKCSITLQMIKIQVADIFTKSLTETQFSKLQSMLGL